MVSHCEAAGFQTLVVHCVAKVALLTFLKDHLATAGFPTLVAYYLETVGLPTFVTGRCATAVFLTLTADRLATVGFLTVADHLVAARFPMLLEDRCPFVANDTTTRHTNFPASPTQLSCPPEISGVLLQGSRPQRGRRKG